MTAGKLIAVALIATAGAAAGAAATAALTTHTPRLLTATFDPPYPAADAAGRPLQAVFEGRIPCPLAGCQRLKVQVALYGGAGEAPASYWLGTIGGHGDERVVETGAAKARRGVAGYAEALAYELDGASLEGLRRFWRVADDILIPLDAEGRPAAGNAAWGTMLSRYDAPYGPRTYVWEG